MWEKGWHALFKTTLFFLRTILKSWGEFVMGPPRFPALIGEDKKPTQNASDGNGMVVLYLLDIVL